MRAQKAASITNVIAAVNAVPATLNTRYLVVKFLT